MSLDHWHIPTTDKEVVDVFLEEVVELLENIDNHMQILVNDPEDKKALTEVRRSFHTIKGSGRMVKALDLAEMAWKVENMLNQAIAEIVPVSGPMVKLVAAIRAQIPRVVDAFKKGRSISGNGDIENLMKLADAFSAGRKPAEALASLAATTTGGKPHFKLYETNLKLYETNLMLERFMQRADEALHRSEMALQLARGISTLSEAPQRAVGQRDRNAEVDRIGELVNLLSKEISDVRLESKQRRRESILHQSEMNHLVEQRVQARLLPTVRLLNKIERDIEKNRQAVTDLRRFGQIALFLSTLVSGVIATALLIAILYLG